MCTSCDARHAGQLAQALCNGAIASPHSAACVSPVMKLQSLCTGIAQVCCRSLGWRGWRGRIRRRRRWVVEGYPSCACSLLLLTGLAQPHHPQPAAGAAAVSAGWLSPASAHLLLPACSCWRLPASRVPSWTSALRWSRPALRLASPGARFSASCARTWTPSRALTAEGKGPAVRQWNPSHFT